MRSDEQTVFEDAILPAGAEPTRFDPIGSSLRAPQASAYRPGDLILDTYRVVAGPIESGGMGLVWRVHHTGWNVDLAMKQPREAVYASKKGKETFIRECSLWINLGLHANIVSCYYVREIDGILCIFSEWMEGGDLAAVIRNGALYEELPQDPDAVTARLLDLAIQFARGLYYAHEGKAADGLPNALIHMDVKPSNLLLGADGEAKVADFGLARARTMLSLQDDEVSASGNKTDLRSHSRRRHEYTQAYCSTEQARGLPLTRRTDVYSWAVCVLEMFCGERDWQSGSLVGLNFQQYAAQAKLPLPPALYRLLEHCLAEDPEDRPRGFGEVLPVLEAIYAGLLGAPYPRSESHAAADTADALNNRALSYLDLGMQEEAERAWNRALDCDPAQPNVLLNRAILAWRAGQRSLTDMETQLFESFTSDPNKYADYTAAFQGELLPPGRYEAEPELRPGERHSYAFNADGTRTVLIRQLEGQTTLTLAQIPGLSRIQEIDVGTAQNIANVVLNARGDQFYFEFLMPRNGITMLALADAAKKDGLTFHEKDNCSIIAISPDNQYLLGYDPSSDVSFGNPYARLFRARNLSTAGETFMQIVTRSSSTQRYFYPHGVLLFNIPCGFSICDPSSGQKRFSFINEQEVRGKIIRVSTADLSPSENYAAACCENGIYVWDAETQSLLSVWSPSYAGGALQRAENRHIRFLSDSLLFVALDQTDYCKGLWYIFDRASGQLVWSESSENTRFEDVVGFYPGGVFTKPRVEQADRFLNRYAFPTITSRQKMPFVLAQIVQTRARIENEQLFLQRMDAARALFDAKDYSAACKSVKSTREINGWENNIDAARLQNRIGAFGSRTSIRNLLRVGPAIAPSATDKQNEREVIGWEVNSAVVSAKSTGNPILGSIMRDLFQSELARQQAAVDEARYPLSSAVKRVCIEIIQRCFTELNLEQPDLQLLLYGTVPSPDGKKLFCRALVDPLPEDPAYELFLSNYICVLIDMEPPGPVCLGVYTFPRKAHPLFLDPIFSPDGSQIIIAAHDGIFLVDVPTTEGDNLCHPFRSLDRMYPAQGFLRLAGGGAFTPDGKFFVFGVLPNQIIVMDIARRCAIFEAKMPMRRMHRIWLLDNGNALTVELDEPRGEFRSYLLNWDYTFEES